MKEGVDGPLRDKKCKPGKQPMPEKKARKLVEIAVASVRDEETHWKVRSLAARVSVCNSVDELEKSILDLIELHNGKEAIPYSWIANPDHIIAAHQRGIV